MQCLKCGGNLTYSKEMDSYYCDDCYWSVTYVVYWQCEEDICSPSYDDVKRYAL